ncbi:MAG: hypothetical protein HY795_17730 [Desulfovibrio sp.]|nr:hypothetical protein [Desulfovibrio sp.]MBI4960985.1 hypothetical protein [Desulfovibrio sp.]
MKRSRHVTIGLVVSVSLALSGCVSDDDDEEYQRGNYHNIIYHSSGRPYLVGEDRSVRPLPADHPNYNAAVAEGQAIASGNKSSTGKTFVSRGGFGSTGAHLSSAS